MSKHNARTAPSAVTAINFTGEFAANGYYLFCGQCDRPAALHPFPLNEDEDFTNVCLRESDEIPYPYEGELGHYTKADYYGYYGADGNPVPTEIPMDYSGSGARERFDLAYDFDLNLEDYASELLAVDNWRDQDPEVGTYATAWTYTDRNGVKSHGTYPEPKGYDASHLVPKAPQSRTVFVEGHDGFQSVEIINEYLTDAYQKRLLNMYADKNGKPRVGAIQFGINAEGNFYGECVNNKCSYKDADGNWRKASITCTADPTREEMESFVLDVIRHGNNHAAAWFTERNTYYKVHATACDLKCDANQPHCNINDPKRPVATDESVVEFLFDHQRYCSDPKCQCSDRLAELVPALAVAN